MKRPDGGLGMPASVDDFRRRRRGAQAAQAGTVTPDMIKQAEWIAGLELTEDERTQHGPLGRSGACGRSPSCARSTSATTWPLP